MAAASAAASAAAFSAALAAASDACFALAAASSDFFLAALAVELAAWLTECPIFFHLNPSFVSFHFHTISHRMHMTVMETMPETMIELNKNR